MPFFDIKVSVLKINENKYYYYNYKLLVNLTMSLMRFGHFAGKSSLPMMAIAALNCF